MKNSYPDYNLLKVDLIILMKNVKYEKNCPWHVPEEESLRVKSMKTKISQPVPSSSNECKKIQNEKLRIIVMMVLVLVLVRRRNEKWGVLVQVPTNFNRIDYWNGNTHILNIYIHVSLKHPTVF